MLVLTRKAGQKIRISEEIVVTVISVRDGNVRLGFDAPADIVIDRQEVFELKQTERRDAGENGEMVGG